MPSLVFVSQFAQFTLNMHVFCSTIIVVDYSERHNSQSFLFKSRKKEVTNALQ